MVSVTAQYALRALARLAEEPESRAVLGRILAEEAGIPANYLSKVLLTMRNAGIVETARGAHGGYRLSHSPSEVPLIEIIEIFDAPRSKPTCLLGLPECSDENACSAHEAWKDVRNRFLNFLESTTLADISAGRAGAFPLGSARAVGSNR